MNISITNVTHGAAPSRVRVISLNCVMGACCALFLTGCERAPKRPRPVPPSTGKTVEPKQESREELIGRRISELQPGMTLHQVEEILGLPNADGLHSAGLEGLGTTSYWCVLPDNPTGGNRLMVLYFDTTVEPAQFIEMTGPHFPGDE